MNCATAKLFLSKSKSSTALVSYASIDLDPTIKDPLANYMSCDSEADAVDLFGLNN